MMSGPVKGCQARRRGGLLGILSQAMQAADRLRGQQAPLLLGLLPLLCWKVHAGIEPAVRAAGQSPCPVLGEPVASVPVGLAVAQAVVDEGRLPLQARPAQLAADRLRQVCLQQAGRLGFLDRNGVDGG